MADVPIPGVPVGFQIHVNRLAQRLDNLAASLDRLQQRVYAVELELADIKRRRGGRPRKEPAPDDTSTE